MAKKANKPQISTGLPTKYFSEIVQELDQAIARNRESGKTKILIHPRAIPYLSMKAEDGEEVKGWLARTHPDIKMYLIENRYSLWAYNEGQPHAT